MEQRTADCQHRHWIVWRNAASSQVWMNIWRFSTTSHTPSLLSHHPVFSQYHCVTFAQSAETDRVNTWNTVDLRTYLRRVRVKQPHRYRTLWGEGWTTTGQPGCDSTPPRRWLSLFTYEHRPGLREYLAERVCRWKFDHKREVASTA